MKPCLLLSSRSLPSGSTRRSPWFRQSVGLLALASLPFFAFGARGADQEDVFTGGAAQSGTSLLGTPGYWSQNIAPTTAYDAIFGPTYPSSATSTLTYSSTTGAYGSLNDVDQFSVITINNAGGTAGVLTLSGGSGNSFAPNSADLLYVGAGASLTIANGSSTLGLALGTSGNFDIAGTATISSNITGAFTLTKTGSGTLTLSGTGNSYSALNVNAGTVSVMTTTLLASAGTITFSGGTLLFGVTKDYSAQYSQAASQIYNLGVTSSTSINATALTSVGGTLTKSGGGVLNLTGANTFSGSSTVIGGSILLSGASGSLASTAINLSGGGLSLTNTGVGGNNTNRIADTAAINLNGGAFVIGGSDQTTTNTTETVGSFTLGVSSVNGNVNNVITVTPGTGGSTTLTVANGLTRAAGSTMALVNGAGLGSSAASTSQFFLGTAPTLIGGGTPAAAGNPGAGVQLNTGIALGLVGESATTTGTGVGTVTGAANTFLTYTAAGGFRPLNPTDEFTNNAFTTGNNTRITTAATTLGTSTTINSLVAGASFALGANTLTNTSGMTLFSASATISGTGALAFGGTEGQIYTDTGLTGTISAPVTGSNGLSISGPGSVAVSGNLTLSGGILANSQHFLTLSGNDNLTGATVVNNAGNAGILFAASLNALNGSTSVTSNNGSQLRFNTVIGTFASGPITLGDTNGIGSGLYFQGPTNNTNDTIAALVTLAGTVPQYIESFNAGTVTTGNAVAITGGISSAVGSTGGVEFQSGGTTVAGDHRITLAGTLNYAGPTQLAVISTSNLRVALNGTSLPSTTVLGFRMPVSATDAQFDLNGNNQTVAGLQTLATTGTAATQIINSSATASALTVNNAVNFVYNGSLGTVGTLNAGGVVPGGTTGTQSGGSVSDIILAAGTSNNFSVVKSGTGMLQLVGANSYSGATTVSAGTLIFGSTGGAPTTPTISSGAGAITVNNSGSTLGGTGSLAGAVTINTGANITGGGAGVVGALTLAGTAGTTQLTLAAGSTYLVDIGNGAASDTLKITGSLLSNGATIQINTGTLDGTDTYTIATYSSDTGSTFAFNPGTSGYSLNDSGTALTLVPTPVPEPATYVGGLLMLGALGWRLRGRFARRVA